MLKFKSSVSIAVLAIILAAPPAYAADMYGGSIKDGTDVPYHEGYGNAFRGLGISIFGGGQFTNIEINDGTNSFDGIGADGLVGGVAVEYLFAAGKFRFGPYVEGALSNVNTNIEFGGGDLDLLEQTHFYGGGLKAGTTLFGGSSFLYGRIGIERAGWEIAETLDANVDSVVAGVGLETMATDQLSIGLGIDYVAPFNIEADGHDVTDLFDETEGFRGLVRATWRR